jgi:hypothetical protein
MFLKPPKAGVKPVIDRSRKSVFTGKAPAKPKSFKSQDEGNEDTETIAPEPPKVETAFVKWLQKKSTNGSAHVEDTKDYLLQGPPYRGEINWDAKDTVKDAGAAWVGNHLKRKNCEDKSVRKGWYSAHAETTLTALLDLPTQRGKRQWMCIGMTDTQLSQVRAWLREFRQASGAGENPQTTNGASSLREEGGEEGQESDAHNGIETELQQQRAQSGVLGKRGRASQGFRIKEPAVPQWILDAGKVPLRPVPPDTKCLQCGSAVTDQFMDCSCQVAIWERCATCMHKYRIDETARGRNLRSLRCACDSAGHESPQEVQGEKAREKGPSSAPPPAKLPVVRPTAPVRPTPPVRRG